MSPAERVVYVAYNVIWWVPVVLTVAGVLSFRAGSIGFLAVSGVRAALNAYRVNVLPAAAAQRFPLRSP